MDNLRKVIFLAFQLSCFVILGRLVWLQFQYFLSNEDFSSVYYKKFRNLNDDVYPTFSVCLYAPHGGLFHNGLKPDEETYYDYIRGKVRNYTTGNKYSNYDYDNIVVSLEDIVLFYKRKSKGSDKKYKEEMSSDFNTSFKMVHQEVTTICFTKNDKEREDRLIKYDLVKLNLTRLYSLVPKFEVTAYIHTKGQFIRKYQKETHRVWWKTIGKMKDRVFNYIVRLHNNAIEVLRRRSDAVKRCNKTLDDEDQRWRLSVVKEVGCIPAFESRLLLGSNEGEHLLETLPKCDNDGYHRHREEYSPFNNFEAATELYTQPCTEMSSVVTNTEDIVYLDNTNMSTLVFKFNYEENYRETINREAFSLADLWSQVGGFVGIFVGYSIMQVPETVAIFYRHIKGMFYSKK